MLDNIETLRELQLRIKRNSRALLFVEKEQKKELTEEDIFLCGNLTLKNEYLTESWEKELHFRTLKSALEWSIKVK